MGGCYAELGAGYYPTVKQTVTDIATRDVMRADTHGWAVNFRLGFYLDVPIAVLRTAIGVGYSPDSFGGDPVLPSDAPADVTAKGKTWRGDITLPFLPFASAPYIRPRLTLVHTTYTGAGIRIAPSDKYDHWDGGSGTGWFFGPTLGMGEWGSSFQVSVGYQTLTSINPGTTNSTTPYDIETSASGFGMRLLFGWTPTLALMKHWTPSKPETGGAQPCTGTITTCDVDGNCRTVPTC